MSGIAAVALLNLALLAAPIDDNYAPAWKKSSDEGRPLIVLIGADWCPGCRTMKYSVVPQLKQQGTFKEACFAIVDVDNDRELASKLTVGGSIPQLVMFHKTADGWKKSRLVGAQSTQTVNGLVKNALAESVDLIAKQPEAEKPAAEATAEAGK